MGLIEGIIVGICVLGSIAYVVLKFVKGNKGDNSGCGCDCDCSNKSNCTIKK